jgi:hypothetical protein
MLPSAFFGVLSPVPDPDDRRARQRNLGLPKDCLQNYSQAGIAPSVPRSWPTELGPNLRWRTTSATRVPGLGDGSPSDMTSGTRVKEQQHAGVPLRPVRALRELGDSSLHPQGRPVGRPAAGSAAAATGAPVSPSIGAEPEPSRPRPCGYPGNPKPSRTAVNCRVVCDSAGMSVAVRVAISWTHAAQGRVGGRHGPRARRTGHG